MLLRWTIAVFLGVLIYKMPPERTVVVYRDAAQAPSSDADAAQPPRNSPPTVVDTSINRALLDELRADPAVLMRQVRVVPLVIDGDPAGFKLYAIAPDSLPHALGFRNGDSVHYVNGEPVWNPEFLACDDCLTDRADIYLTRRGAPVLLRITVID